MGPIHGIRTGVLTRSIRIPAGVAAIAGSGAFGLLLLGAPRGLEVGLAALAGYCFVLLLLAPAAGALRSSLGERHRRSAHQAHHDRLTGLPNRTLLQARLAALTARREPHALLRVDLDDFKVVNDTYGHVQGDRVLQTVAGRLDDCLRGSDLVARFDGDEFAVLVEYCPERGVAEQLAARIIDNIKRPIEVGGSVVRLGASVGVAFNAPTAERALRLAGTAREETRARL